jgi:hypothetical protein
MSIKQGSNLIAGSGGGVSNIDNLTITENANEEIQTVGVIDSNNTTNAIKIWTGTKALYDAIVTKDANTEYLCTDTGEIYLGTVKLGGGVPVTILEALYPVGSVYITTANTCPLSALISGSTWELVSSGRVLQGADSSHSAGTTIEAGLPNITGSTDLSSDVAFRNTENKNGCFYLDTTKHHSYVPYGYGEQSSFLGFNASRSSSIYGNSTTVQPPAYVVNIYRRTA